jgi:uncharacterized protein involved in exopolysaccharide biosynthesis
MTQQPTELDLQRLAARVWSQRWPVLAVSVAAGALALLVAFLMPKWYRATVVILPPDESDLLSTLSLAHRALSKFPAFGMPGDYFTPADIFKATLKSRMAQEYVADRFQLQKVYDLKSREKTLKNLEGLTRVKLSADGTIAVSVEDRDGKRAAAMAMAYVEALDRYNIEKRNTSARRARMFLERRLAETDSLLHQGEGVLRQYQEAHHTIAPATMGSNEIQSAADVMARKLLLEVRLGVLRSYLREDNDQVVQALTELEQLKKQINALPSLETQLGRMIRSYKVQEQLYLLLTAELEQARLNELQDTPTVTILDPAIPPERHSRPRRLAMGLVAGLLAFLGSVTYVAIRGEPQLRART